MKHVRRALIAILILLTTLPCAAMASAHFTGYINQTTYIYKNRSTSCKKRQKVTVNTKVYVIGSTGKFYKVKNARRTHTGYVLKRCVSKKKVPASTKTESAEPEEENDVSWKSKVVKLEWFKTGKNVMKRGTYAYLYDTSTGIKLRIKRMGGTSHADVEPATAADTTKLKKIAGGKFSWVCHPVILMTNGKYVACSINTMPHGRQTITSNNYNGQFCLHMIGSLTHGTQKVNPSHQACIEKAYKWARG